MTSNRRRAALLLSAGCLVTAVSCSSEPKNRGQLMIALSADLSIPENMNEVVIEVVGANGDRQTFAAFVKPEGDKPMPGTMAVVPRNAGGDLVRVRVIGRRSSANDVQVRVVRQAIVRVPRDRIAMLPMPIRWLCDGNFEPDPDPTNPGSFRNACGEDETCQAGRCVDATVQETDLPDYDVQKVFGGGDEDGNGGTCLDVRSCFEKGVPVVPDLGNCSIPKPGGGDGVNVAIVPTTSGEGHCNKGDGAGDCFVPLDQHDGEGWKEVGGRIQLPGYVCDQWGGKVKGLVVTTACPTKDLTMPLCGPWTNVEAVAPVGAPTEPIGGVTEGDGGIAVRPDGGGGEGGGTAFVDGGGDARPTTCDDARPPVTLLPAGIHLLVDTSVHMSAYRSSLISALNQWQPFLPQHVHVGLTLMEGLCGDPMSVAVPLGATAETLESMIGTASFSEDLPFEEGILAAQQDVQSWRRANPTGVAAIGIVTAMGPTCGAPNAVTLTQSAFEATPSTPTHVIALSSETQILTDVAAASGSFVRLADGAVLQNTLDQLTAAAAPCRFEVPGYTGTERVLRRSEADGDTVLQFFPGGCQDFPSYVTDSLGMPDVFELCPNDCAQLLASPTSQIIVESTGCGGGSTGGGGAPGAGGAAGIGGLVSFGGTAGQGGAAVPIGGGAAALDAGSRGCPVTEPGDGSPCSQPGLSCPYAATNCMCEGTTWRCFFG